MSDISIILPDGAQKVLPQGSKVEDVARSIGPGLLRDAIVGRIDGELVDLSHEVQDGQTIEILTWKAPESLEILRHSTAHILAAAVCNLFEGAQYAIGPAIENGFYYDFEIGRGFTPEDLDTISEEMQRIIDTDTYFERKVVSVDEAKEVFASQPMKLELIDELDKDETITLYYLGDFVDLCRGPHLPASGCVKAFKLTSIAGAYWRGDSSRPMLQRIYGTAFFGKKPLEKYLEQQAEAEKRDHRKLGKQLGIYTMNESAGPGLPFFLPNGARVVRTMQDWLRRVQNERGYEELITPHIYKSDVWKTSGHYYYYHDDMYFFEVDEGDGKTSEFGVKPMNCPGHVICYKANPHSYRELPVRFFEFGTVYRHELSGVVHGLFRVRGFTQDDAHIFCREDQVVDEVEKIMTLVDYIMGTFDLSYTAEISTRPAKSIGTDEMWDRATDALKAALDKHETPYAINEGDGAFYGPKIDIKVKDSLGRTWQCSTIQVDFNLPERFDLTYRTAENTDERPWMLHRAIFGSMERFLGILIEHYAGNLPLWLAPVQVEIIPIADRHLDYAEEVATAIRMAGGRVQISARNEPMRVKIAKAQEQKIPYMLVVGDKEAETKTVSVRERGAGDQGTQDLLEFVKVIEAAHV